MKKTPSATVTVGDGAESSTQTPPSGSFSLYFHVPFCSKKCDYCHFFVLPNQTRFHDIYKTSLKKEWDLRSILLPKSELVSVYFGGGTPALLGPSAIGEILSWVNPPPSCEVTLEANPENVALAQMKDFKAVGINRVSLGVQTLDNELLKKLSRTHHAEHSLQAVLVTAQAGIENISIDLMYDLPGQTLHSWKKTLQHALHLPISHLSLYNLTIEPHTVFFKKKNTLKLPSETTSLHMLEAALDALQAGGLQRYEISAFAKEGKKSRHNLGYWTGRPFLGFGPSACSYWDKSRFRNVAHLNKYAKSLDQNIDPKDFTETLPAKELLKESLAIGLRVLEGVPIATFPQEIHFGLQKLISEGLLENSNHHIRLTKQGLLFHDTVAERIMSL